MSGASGRSFYSRGLRFECTRCSRCCRFTPGYVFLSERDLERLSSALALMRAEFLRQYCRKIAFGAIQRISLTEKPNLDCVFWKEGGCSVYEARPLQCRSFPFWSSCLSSRKEWEQTSRHCPGIGKGRLHDLEEIEGWLRMRAQEGFVEE
jgi:Fe-S-cluster containining protein